MPLAQLYLHFFYSISNGFAAPPVEDFARLPDYANIKISPDGKKFAAKTAIDNQYILSIIAYEGGELDVLYMLGLKKDQKFRFIEWVSNERLILSVGLAGKRYGTETYETRLFGMNADGSDIEPLFKADDSGWLQQIQDDIVTLLPNDPERVIVQYGGEKERALYVKIDRARTHRIAQRAITGIQNWKSDYLGNIRIGSGLVNEKKPKLILKMEDEKWKDFSHRVTNGFHSFYVLGAANRADHFFVTSTHETDTSSLYLFNALTDQFVEQIYTHPSSDIYNIVQHNQTGELLGVIFAESESQVEWLETNLLQKLLRDAKKALPGKDVSIASLNSSEEHAVIYADSDNRPGTYYLMDIKGRAILALDSQYPELDNQPLGKVIATSYNARDGL